MNANIISLVIKPRARCKKVRDLFWASNSSKCTIKVIYKVNRTQTQLCILKVSIPWAKKTSILTWTFETFCQYKFWIPPCLRQKTLNVCLFCVIRTYWLLYCSTAKALPITVKYPTFCFQFSLSLYKTFFDETLPFKFPQKYYMVWLKTKRLNFLDILPVEECRKVTA